MEAALVYWDYFGVLLGLDRENGKEHGSCSSILGLFWGLLGLDS